MNIVSMKEVQCVLWFYETNWRSQFNAMLEKNIGEPTPGCQMYRQLA